MRLLLAEDEKELAKALGVILRHNNYSVDVVHNGEDALCYLENGDYEQAAVHARSVPMLKMHVGPEEPACCRL